jgi:transposase
VRYSEAFKAKMVQKMAGPAGRSASALSDDVGVPQVTLSRWLKQAGTVPAVSKRKKRDKKTKAATGGAKRPQDWSAEDKLRVVFEAASLSDDELGEFLRREGLHEVQLEQWRQQAMEALGTQRRRAKASPEAKRIRELEKELARKEKALAEAAALIVLKKKAQAIWGDEDDDTDPRSGK